MGTNWDEETTGGETRSAFAFSPKTGQDVRGELEKVSLEEILTSVFCARATGTLTVEASPADAGAELVIWKGDPIACTFGNLAGNDAAVALLKRKKGQFRFTDELEPREQNVNKTIPELVNEAKGRKPTDKRPKPR